MLATPRPESVREPEEVLLVDRVQHRNLARLILKGGNRQRALTAIRFRNVAPSRRVRPVRPSMDPLVQSLDPAITSVIAEGLNRHAARALPNGKKAFIHHSRDCISVDQLALGEVAPE
jgi:hypothetical protein